MTNNSQIDNSSLRLFHEQMRGAVLTSGDLGYDRARAIWNGRIDGRPKAIARCVAAADVITAVNFAREHGLLLSIKSGGHSYAGKSTCNDSLMIDLSQMNDVQIDERARTAVVGPGATWGAFDERAQAFGLATTGGTVSSVGVGGLALGGGSGYLARKYGLTVDNLIAADIVTADGRLVHASQQENPDLFWGLRGGGGNFGVVTSLAFQLHEVGPTVLAGQIIFSFQDALEVLQFYRTFMSTAPDEVQCYAFLLRVPPLPEFPAQHHGKVALDLVVCCAGSLTEGKAVLQPLRDLGKPILDTVQPMPYTALQQAFDGGLPKGQRYYSKAVYLPELSDELITVVLQHAETLRGTYTTAYFSAESGAASRPDSAATAFPHRHGGYGFHIIAGWENPEADDEVIGWARGFFRSLIPYSSSGIYVNLLGEDEDDRVPASYGTNYQRLVEIKNKWDPDNLFQINHNIAPTGR
jgi:FAD/FMN-containing dehydrogenase